MKRETRGDTLLRKMSESLVQVVVPDISGTLFGKKLQSARRSSISNENNEDSTDDDEPLRQKAIRKNWWRKSIGETQQVQQVTLNQGDQLNDTPKIDNDEHLSLNNLKVVSQQYLLNSDNNTNMDSCQPNFEHGKYSSIKRIRIKSNSLKSSIVRDINVSALRTTLLNRRSHAPRDETSDQSIDLLFQEICEQTTISNLSPKQSVTYVDAQHLKQSLISDSDASMIPITPCHNINNINNINIDNNNHHHYNYNKNTFLDSKNQNCNVRDDTSCDGVLSPSKVAIGALCTTKHMQKSLISSNEMGTVFPKRIRMKRSKSSPSLLNVTSSVPSVPVNTLNSTWPAPASNKKNFYKGKRIIFKWKNAVNENEILNTLHPYQTPVVFVYQDDKETNINKNAYGLSNKQIASKERRDNFLGDVVVSNIGIDDASHSNPVTESVDIINFSHASMSYNFENKTYDCEATTIINSSLFKPRPLFIGNSVFAADKTGDGKLWPGIVQKIKYTESKAYIKYDGYSHNYNKWISINQVIDRSDHRANIVNDELPLNGLAFVNQGLYRVVLHEIKSTYLETGNTKRKHTSNTIKPMETKVVITMLPHTNLDSCIIVPIEDVFVLPAPLTSVYRYSRNNKRTCPSCKRHDEDNIHSCRKCCYNYYGPLYMDNSRGTTISIQALQKKKRKYVRKATSGTNVNYSNDNQIVMNNDQISPQLQTSLNINNHYFTHDHTEDTNEASEEIRSSVLVRPCAFCCNYDFCPCLMMCENCDGTFHIHCNAYNVNIDEDNNDNDGSTNSLQSSWDVWKCPRCPLYASDSPKQSIVKKALKALHNVDVQLQKSTDSTTTCPIVTNETVLEKNVQGVQLIRRSTREPPDMNERSSSPYIETELKKLSKKTLSYFFKTSIVVDSDDFESDEEFEGDYVRRSVETRKHSISSFFDRRIIKPKSDGMFR